MNEGIVSTSFLLSCDEYCTSLGGYWFRLPDEAEIGEGRLTCSTREERSAYTLSVNRGAEWPLGHPGISNPLSNV